MQNQEVALRVVPERGANIASLILRRSGHEFLLQPSNDRLPFGTLSPTTRFEDSHPAGFDDCFPTVAPCALSTPDGIVNLPDHGELWSSAWDWEWLSQTETLRLRTSGTKFTYELEKKLRLEGQDLVIEYEIRSPVNGKPFPFLWSAHPLLNVCTGDQILMPSDVSSLYVEWSLGDRLGQHGDTCQWPQPLLRDGSPAKLDILEGAEMGTADKLFTSPLTVGACALYSPSSKSAIIFRFDPNSIRHLGLWICQGGWPESGPSKHFTVALEPTTSRGDSLAEVAERNESEILHPGESKSWSLRIQLRDAVEAPIL
jgi:galactose mutarotase-like enzyme